MIAAADFDEAYRLSPATWSPLCARLPSASLPRTLPSPRQALPAISM